MSIRFFSKLRDTSLACLSSCLLCIALPANAQKHEFRANTETLKNGIEITQHVNATAFPAFKGSRVDPANNELPAVKDSNSLRSVRILLPIDTQRRANFVMTAQGTGIMAGEIDARTLSLRLTGPLLSGNPNPFVVIDTRTQISSEANGRVWKQVVSFDRPVSANATHLLVRAYVLPKIDGAPSAVGGGNLVFGVDEVAVSSEHVVTRASLVFPVILSFDENGWAQWRQQAMRAGTFDLLTAMDGLPHGNAALVEQRTIALLGGAQAPRRDRRCLDDFLLAMAGHIFEVAFGERSICELDPAAFNAPAHRLPLIEIVPAGDPPPAADMTVYEALTRDSRENAFDAAMGTAFCNDDHENAAESQEDACTVTDREVIAALGNLSFEQLTALRNQVNGVGSSAQREPWELDTGNAEVNRWLNADTQRAINAIDAAIAIANHSDARAEPTKPVKRKKKGKVLEASCIAQQAEADERNEVDDPWQTCVKKARGKLNDSGVTVAVTPHVRTSRGYALRDTDAFNQLATRFKNTGKSMPDGVSEQQFNSYTRAIAEDQARVGDNLGIVFLNDPAFPPGNTQRRFRYGLEHIWAPGSGGGDDDGHRDDWRALQGLSVNSREMLTAIVMAALTDPNATYTQQRNRRGNLARTYKRFTFRQGDAIYVINNIRIVLAQNGMVITAYPLKGAKAQSLNM